uniref:Uncharacterized protein n=1 Tax=Oncorhynchus tshawytscha TaxID=74940 RepID=A0AAZ3QXV6_ONCTS
YELVRLPSPTTVALNEYLSSRSYLAGFSPSRVDQEVFELLHRPPGPAARARSALVQAHSSPAAGDPQPR